MNLPAVNQVSANSTEYLKNNISKSRQQEAYFASYWEKQANYRREYQSFWIAQKRAKKEERDKERENLKKRERTVDKISSHTRSSLTSRTLDKELFFCWKRGEFERRLDKQHLRLASKDKKALKKYSNQPWFKEWLDKDCLLKKYQEWSIRGGTKMGKKYLRRGYV